MSLTPPPLAREGIDEAVRAIREAQEIALACHINPDGDTLGSMIALALGLGQIGKRTTILSADGVPAILRFLPDIERVQKSTDRRDFDLTIGLDAGELARFGVNREVIEKGAPRVLDIDHHVTPGAFGDIRLLDATAAATGEIVYDLLRALGADITLPMATCLLCALLTDTGSFRFLNTTPRTMRIAGEMIAVGASPNSIAEAVFENKTFAAQKLMGRALESLQRSPDNRVVWAHVTQADFQEFGGTDEDTEGIVNAVRAVQGTDVALFLREMPSGRLRVSLRSRPPADVSVVAAHFGGGGHHLAAGCTLDGPIADAETRLVAEVARQLAAKDTASPVVPPPDPMA